MIKSVIFGNGFILAGMTENLKIEHIVFSDGQLDEEYYDCTFVKCDFSELQIADTVFDRCVFQDCNLSMTAFKGVLQDVSFVRCKMVGADFSAVGRTSGGLEFDRSVLDYGVFVRVKLRRTVFSGCMMRHASFDSADLAESSFGGTDLAGTSFLKADLRSCDFSEAYNFCMNPEHCRLCGAVFSESGLRGLVGHLKIKIKS